MEIATLVLGIILIAMVASIGASLIFIAIVIGLGIGVLIIVRNIIGKILEKVCGKEPEWLRSKVFYVIEGIIGVAVIWLWFTTPTQALNVPLDDCAYISISRYVGDGNKMEIIDDPEAIAEFDKVFKEQKVTRRINVRFLNEGMVDGPNGLFIAFYREDDSLIRRVRVTSELIGISKKDQGNLTFYAYYNFVDKLSYGSILDKYESHEYTRKNPLKKGFFSSN